MMFKYAEDEVLSALDLQGNRGQVSFLEAQDYASVYAAVSADERSLKGSMEIDDHQGKLGEPNSSIAEVGEDGSNKEAHVMKARDTEVRGFKSHYDPSGICDNYLLGSSEGLQLLVSKGQVPNLSDYKADTSGRSCRLEAMTQDADCHDNVLPRTNPEPHGSNNECEISVEDRWSDFHTTFPIHDFDRLEDVSGLLTGHLYYDKDDSNLFLPSGLSNNGTFCASTLEQYHEPTSAAGQVSELERLCEGDAKPQGSTQLSTVDLPPAQKRVRKPTRRYIDESVDLNLISVKKRRIPSSTSKGKVLKDKREKDDHTDTATVCLFPEESVAKPIQVPFGSLVGGEHSEDHTSAEVGVLNSDDVSFEDQRPSNPIKNVGFRADGGWIGGDCFTGVRYEQEGCGQRESNRVKKLQCKENGLTMITDRITKVIHKGDQGSRESYRLAKVRSKGDGGLLKNCIVKERSKEERGQRESDCLTIVGTGEVDGRGQSDCITKVKSKEDGRRKHHRLWTISEVRKLVEGVSQYGVGRWTDIKRLFFSSAHHRTSVDLKDKWRNLLKASRLQKQSKTDGNNKRNLAWRPLPNSVLNRVCELATIYPYPRGRKTNLSLVECVSSPISIDRSA